jgi:hypothetical protein
MIAYQIFFSKLMNFSETFRSYGAQFNNKSLFYKPFALKEQNFEYLSTSSTSIIHSNIHLLLKNSQKTFTIIIKNKITIFAA